jgi:hypothetical protein
MSAFLMRFLLRVNLAAAVSVGFWLSAIESGSSQAAGLEQLLKDGRVPGLSFALIRDGKIVETKELGVRDTSTGAPMNSHTIFEAAEVNLVGEQDTGHRHVRIDERGRETERCRTPHRAGAASRL